MEWNENNEAEKDKMRRCVCPLLDGNLYIRMDIGELLFIKRSVVSHSIFHAALTISCF